MKWKSITKEEKLAKELEQENMKKIAEAKAYLDDTDHKIYPHYTPKDGENIENIKQKRYDALMFIRANKLAC